MNILIVDDEDLIRRSLQRAFQARHVNCLEARNGVEALTLLSNQSIDLVILDLLMPEKNGFDVLSEMPQKIPVIIISAFSGQSHGDFKSEEYSNVIGFIKKPFDHIQNILNEVMSIYENHIRKV